MSEVIDDAASSLPTKSKGSWSMVTTQKIPSLSLSAVLLHTLLIGCATPSHSESVLDGDTSPATDTPNTLAAPALVDNEAPRQRALRCEHGQRAPRR